MPSIKRLLQQNLDITSIGVGFGCPSGKIQPNPIHEKRGSSSKIIQKLPLLNKKTKVLYLDFCCFFREKCESSCAVEKNGSCICSFIYNLSREN